MGHDTVANVALSFVLTLIQLSYVCAVVSFVCTGIGPYKCCGVPPTYDGLAAPGAAEAATSTTTARMGLLPVHVRGGACAAFHQAGRGATGASEHAISSTNCDSRFGVKFS